MRQTGSDDKHWRREVERRRQDWIRRTEVSAKHRNDIVVHAESGRPASGLEQALASSVLGPVDAIVSTVTLGAASAFIGRREALEYWSRRLKEAWGLLSEHKAEMLGRDKSEAFEQLKSIQAECDDAWAQFKQDKTEHREAQQKHHDEWRERMEARRDRLQALLDKNEDVIERLEQQIEDLQDKIATAWNDDWAAEAEGWVEEKQQKIRDIQATNEDLEEKIKEIDARLTQ